MSLALILSIAVQVALVVHIVKTGRNMTWVFIVLFFPVVGALAYVIVELLPEFSGSRTARSAQRSLARAIDPDKAFREATEQYELAQTAQNAMTLAAQHLARADFAAAKALYQRSLSGVHSDDPDLLIGLAQAQFGLGEYAEVIRCLDALKTNHPSKTSQEGHLLYARALQEQGRSVEALQEYQALVRYCAGPEPSCRLATLLKAEGRGDEARALFETVVTRSKSAGAHYNKLYREWVALAKRELQG